MKKQNQQQITNRLVDLACEEYIKSLTSQFFVVGDLYKAVIEGANFITKKQHECTIEAAEMYVKEKDKDLVYTAGEVERAFKAGARIMLNVTEAEREKEQHKIRLKREEMQKLAKLICACEQLMEIADNFNKEAECILSKNNLFRHEIKSEWKGIAKKFGSIKSQLSKVFMGFSADEGYDWCMEGEAIENAVREIMKIDVCENYG